MSDLDGHVDWRRALRDARRRRAISATRLAQAAGVSASAIRSYETGVRHPSRIALESIIDGLGLSSDEANPIRSGAGYATDWSMILNRRYLSDIADLRRLASEYPWPVFITNQGSYVVDANAPFEAVLDVQPDHDFPDPRARNLLGGATLARMVNHIENYDELMTFFLGLVKGDPRHRQDPEQPAPWLMDAVRRLLDGDAAYVRRLLDIWEHAPPIEHRIRHRYRVVWRWRREHTLRFIGTLSPADVADDLWWQEWVPADAVTSAKLESIVSGEWTCS